MSIETDLYALIDPMVEGEVIWMDQNSPRPPLPYYTMKIMSVRYVNQDYHVAPDSNGDEVVKGDREFTLTVQRYQKFDSTDVTSQLQTLVDRLRLTTVIDKFMARKLVAFNTGAVTDISALLDKTQIEKRATVDIFMRYKSSLVDNVGIVETVSVEATDNSSAPAYNPLVEVVNGVVIRP